MEKQAGQHVKPGRKTGTAGYTCFTRACSARDPNPLYHGSDDLAQLFLPFFALIMLNVPALRGFMMRKIAPAGIYEYIIARTRVMDATFQQALADGFQQIVILGAGMDTRALRFAYCNKNTRVFELDLARTQRQKQAILKKKSVALPTGLSLVEIDLNSQEMGAALAAAGFQGGLQTLFLCEGLFMYLDAEAVDRSLAFMRASAAPGSRLVFDYVQASVLRGEQGQYGEQDIFKTVANTGEVWTFGIEPNAIANFLAVRGFQLNEHFSAAKLEKRYFIDETGRQYGRVNGAHCIAAAVLE
jgi:methyltransferase (TIGR00027 family)